MMKVYTEVNDSIHDKNFCDSASSCSPKTLTESNSNNVEDTVAAKADHCLISKSSSSITVGSSPSYDSVDYMSTSLSRVDPIAKGTLHLIS